jgi:NADPH2:quinone reductase
VDVRACSATFPDVLMIQGLYQFKPPFPFSPGGEIAGVVSAVGDGVTTVAPGDRVIVPLGWGGMAEQLRAPAPAVVPLPDGVGFEAAAGFLYAYGTAFHALRDRGALRPGETLLVLGAAGGVGLAAVELGATMGATVVAAASSESKLAVCRERGAAMTIDYEQEDLKSAVRELTGGRGADVVYDPVGGRFSGPALRSIAWSGRYLVIGFAAGEIPKLPLNLPLLKGCSVVGVFWGAFVQHEPERANANATELVGMLGDGRLQPHVSATFPLAEGGQAIRHLADRKAEGRVVVTTDT